ncbi:MAG: DNA-directed RNA polymerase subunit B'' [Candidatus Micrarchaeia archaeon]
MAKQLLENYFRENSLVKQHLDSYNKFIDSGLASDYTDAGIQAVIKRFGNIQPSIEGFELKLGKVRLEKPMIVEADGSKRPIYPMEARLRNLTYAAPIILEIIPVFNGIEKPTYSEVFIGEFPVMVRSKLCHLSNLSEDELVEHGEDANDPGGYFIINGSERSLVSIEDLAPNRIIVSKEKDGAIITSKVFSTRWGFRARCAVERTNDGNLRVVFPAAPKDLQFTSVLRALGLETDREILATFSQDRHVQADILLNLEVDDVNAVKNGASAFEHIGKKVAPGQADEYRVKRSEVLIDQYLLPHIGGTPQDRLKKAYYLVKMAERAVRVAYKDIAQDDKDHYANKRIKLSGDLMEELFRYAFQFLVKDVSYQAGRADARGRRLIVQTLVRPDALTDRIRYSLATGNWIAGQTGVSQLLDRTSYLATASHLRRIISPLSRKHPHFKARDLHGTHWGKLCPNESPEGPSCALVKNLSLLCSVSIGENEEKIEAELRKLGVTI